jgi:N-acetylgalactosamine-6-sulfatase
MVERMDQGIGKVLHALQERNLADNTLVIFMSDNGANRTGRNFPFSGYKGNLFEGGIRVPCVVKWPGILPRNAVSDQVCITMDFSRSIIRAAGAKPPAHRSFDGIDVLHRIKTRQSPRERTLFWRARRGQRTRKAVRHGNLKYLSLRDGNDVREYLFDLDRDPAEKDNLFAERKETVQQLKLLLRQWEDDVKPSR